MDMNKLTALVTILVTLSIATERLVEIVKGWKPDRFKPPEPNEIGVVDSKEEAKFKAKIHLLAIVCGMFTTFLASPLLADIFSKMFPDGQNCKFAGLFEIGSKGTCGFELNLTGGILIIVALGLLASGGSGLWNSVLEYLLKIKDLKKVEVNKSEAMAKIEVAVARKEAITKGAILDVE